MNDSTASIRLKHFMDYKGMTNSQFADCCGIPRPTLSQLLSGRNKKLSDQVLRPIHDHFPELSVLWLMFGEGDMLASVDTDFVNPQIADTGDSESSVAGSSLKSNSVENKIVNQHPGSYSAVRKSSRSVDSDRSAYDSAPSECDRYEDNRPGKQGVRSDETSIARARRSVRSVVVYYDDNTYETFVPGEIGLSFP